MRPKVVILLVDEISEREALVPIFRLANVGGEVHVATDPTSALDLIGSEHFDAVFSCLSSGADESVDFLAEVWAKSPASARFVLAPVIDAETQLRCAFGAHNHLLTPVDLHSINAALLETRVKDAILHNNQVELLIAKTRFLPSKPTIYFEVMQLLQSENASVEEISTVIGKDLGIASKLIQVVNSSFYGNGQTIGDIVEAVLFLGLDITTSIVLSLEATARFEKSSPYVSVDEIWMHSQEVARMTRKICQVARLNREISSKAYLAALLHDIGKLVLPANFPEHFQSSKKSDPGRQYTHIEWEREVLSVNHADAGAYLLAVWGLPMTIVEAIAGHHSPPTVFKEFNPGAIIHVAERLVESQKPLRDIYLDYPPNLELEQHLEAFESITK